MTEWQVVGVLVALFGFVFTVTKPIINLTKTITELNFTCQELKRQFETFKEENNTGHKRIWDHEGKQDELLLQHGQRLHDLDGKGGI